ncbi:MAG: hypothetical protein ACLQIB_40500 [Isosphaeraceae bacterium]|jgi:hypothetical protein
MSQPVDWALAYAQQTKADFRAWELYCVMCRLDEPLSNSSAGRLTESSTNWSTEMTGPILRRYGFPNFEKIFGKRPLEHGVDEPEEHAFAVKGDEKPSESTPASGAIPKAPVQKQPPKGK